MVLKWSKEIVRNGLLLPFLLCLIYQALRVTAEQSGKHTQNTLSMCTEM